jgi:hypothetical protein
MTKAPNIRPVDGELLAERVHDLVREVTAQGPMHTRSYLPMTGEKTMILPGKTVEIRTHPQIPFRGDRLVVWSGSAPYFMIEDIRVGNRAIGVQAGSIPADAYATRLDMLPVLDTALEKNGVVTIRVSKMAEECFGQLIALPLARSGTQITLVVTNVSAEPRWWRAGFLGAVE